MAIETLHMRRLAPLLVVGVLAFPGLAACGGDDDESQDSGVTTAQTRTEAKTDEKRRADSKPARRSKPEPKPSTGPALTGDVEEAREGAAAVDDVYAGFGAAVDAGIASTKVPPGNTLEAAEGIESLTGICDLMSEEAKNQTIVYAKRSAGLAGVDWTCEKATALLLRRARQSGGLKRSLRAEIVGVNVEGDQATASVRFGGKGPISTVPLVKEDGEWKLAASPSGGGGE
jgi:hypothetical protein